jgi:DNA-binding Xre family transcriptional regulator
MKTILTAFVAIILTMEMIYPVGAVNTPNVDEIEMMLKRIERNMKMALVVVSSAKKQGEKMVESKVVEKAELKEAIAIAETKVEQLEQTNEIFVAKMMDAGIDTAQFVIDDAQNAGPIFDAYLEYKKNGGTEDFNYFRLYIYK